MVGDDPLGASNQTKAMPLSKAYNTKMGAIAQGRGSSRPCSYVATTTIGKIFWDHLGTKNFGYLRKNALRQKFKNLNFANKPFILPS
jgi:hypothetical protein